MHSSSSASDAPDFWPGYVDALINVVLNLLFVVAIFCLALFVTGLKAGKQAPPPVEPPSATAPPEPQPLDVAPPRPAQRDQEAVPPRRLHVRLIAPLSVQTPRILAERLDADTGEIRLKLSFPRGSTALDDAVTPLIEALVLQELKPDQALLLQSATDLAQQGGRRATYLRLMELRNLLIATGHPAARIDVRMTGGGHWPEVRTGEVWILTVPELGAAAPAVEPPSAAPSAP